MGDGAGMYVCMYVCLGYKCKPKLNFKDVRATNRRRFLLLGIYLINISFLIPFWLASHNFSCFSDKMI